MPVLVCVTAILAAASCAAAATPPAVERPFEATRLTADGAFTQGIEGPACDRDGDVFAVNFGRDGTVGRVTPDGRGEVFLTLPDVGKGNGIRFGPDGEMYVADHRGHRVFRVDPADRSLSVFARADFHQPNDLAIAPDGTLYASDPDFKNRAGRVWRIGRDGEARVVADGLDAPNGIEVSPDGRRLYVGETSAGTVRTFAIAADGSLGEPSLLIRFPDHLLDGMRCDAAGNLFVTRPGAGVVAVVSPDGRLLREVDVLGSKPSNLTFGGPDGRTVYVTEVEHRRLVRFRTDVPGAEWAARAADAIRATSDAAGRTE